MKTLLSLALVLLIVGCGTTAQRQAYNSLATTGVTVSTAYESYLDLVLHGKVPTNDVPKITASYRQFYALYQAACETAQWATNLTATPPEVVMAGGAVTSAVNKAKGQ